jgi:hypothetical protein
LLKNLQEVKGQHVTKTVSLYLQKTMSQTMGKQAIKADPQKWLELYGDMLYQ